MLRELLSRIAQEAHLMGRGYEHTAKPINPALEFERVEQMVDRMVQSNHAPTCEDMLNALTDAGMTIITQPMLRVLHGRRMYTYVTKIGRRMNWDWLVSVKSRTSAADGLRKAYNRKAVQSVLKARTK